MSISQTTTSGKASAGLRARRDRGTTLSSVWIFLVLSFIYLPVGALVSPDFLSSLVSGDVTLYKKAEDNARLIDGLMRSSDPVE